MMTKTSNYLTKEEIVFINQEAGECVQEILDELEVEYFKNGKKLCGPCPVHEGDNPSGWSVFIDGHSAKGNWMCHTHGCHQYRNVNQNGFGNTMLGLVHGILSVKNPKTTLTDAGNWLKTFLKIDQTFKINPADVERREWLRQAATFFKSTTAHKNIATLAQARKNLIIPSPYFVKRGYSPEILDLYSVGDCMTKGKEMYYRAVAPILSNDCNHIIGAIARSLWNECPNCNLWHDPKETCFVSAKHIKKKSKWLNSEGLTASSVLYNLWYATNIISLKRQAILVEGAGDVWKLEQAGIHNSLAILGKNFSDEQQLLLEKAGVIDIIVLLDQDDAGRQGCEAIKNKLGNFFRLSFPTISKKDVGELSISEIETEIKPLIVSE